MAPQRHLPRYAAMCGFFGVPPMHPHDYRIYGASEIDVPDEIVPRILAMYSADRATGDLRAMGEAMGKINIPSNINVWQHVKGETRLTQAAEALTDAAKQLTDVWTK